MSPITRRSTFAALAAALIAPVVARAQGATTGPAGGIPSSTAPSNSQGTPAGGTGVVGTSQMPMGGAGPGTSGTPMDSTTSPHTAPHHRRHRRHRSHRSTTSTPQ